MQPMPELVQQAVISSHACPALAQPGATWQTLAAPLVWHVSSAFEQQPVRSEHASPRALHVAACVQISCKQVKPVQHALAAPHDLPSAMHVGGALHVLCWHVSSSPSVQHASISEHGSPDEAHVACVSHFDCVHTRLLLGQHDTSSLHACPFAAHVGAAVHVPSSHVRSSSVQQSADEVQSAPSSAQVAGSAHSPVRQARSGQQSLLALHSLPASTHAVRHTPDWQLRLAQQSSAAAVQLAPLALQASGEV